MREREREREFLVQSTAAIHSQHRLDFDDYERVQVDNLMRG
jgi:hypothetical protein